MKIEKRVEVILLILVIMFSVIIGTAIVDLSQGFTIGRMAKKIGLPAIVFCILFAVFSTKEKLPVLWDLFQFENFSAKVIPLLLISGIFMGTIVSRYGHSGLTYAMIGTICIIGLVSSFVYTTSRKDITGISILLFIYPFILFFEHKARYLLWDDPYEIHAINILKPSEIVWIVMFFLIIIQKFIDKEKLEILAVQKYYIILGLLLLISAIFSPVPSTSLKFPYRDVLLPLVLLTVFVAGIKTKNDFNNLFNLFTISMTLELVAIVYFFFRVGGQEEPELFRSGVASSVAGLVGFYGILASQVSIAYISLFSSARKMLMRSVYFFFLLASLFVVLMSRMRSLQIAFVITCPFLFIRKKSISIFVILISFVLTVLSFRPEIRQIVIERYIPWAQGKHLFATILEKEHFRVDVYIASVNMFIDHPIWGIGWGMWNELIHRYWSHPIVPNGPHSALVFYFVTGGFMVGIMFVVLWLHIIKKAVRLLIANRKREFAPQIIALVWMITSSFIVQLITGRIIFYGYGYTFIPVCLLFSLDKVLSKEHKNFVHKM